MLRNIRIYNDYGGFVNIIFTSICLFDNMKLPTDLLCLLTVFNSGSGISLDIVSFFWEFCQGCSIEKLGHQKA